MGSSNRPKSRLSGLTRAGAEEMINIHDIDVEENAVGNDHDDDDDVIEQSFEMTLPAHSSSVGTSLPGVVQLVDSKMTSSSSTRRGGPRTKSWLTIISLGALLGVVFLSLSLTLWNKDDSNGVPVGAASSDNGESLSATDAPKYARPTLTGGGASEGGLHYFNDEDEEDDDDIDDYDDDDYVRDGDLEVEDIYANPPDFGKLAWPELVGVDVDEAMAIVFHDTQNQVEVIIIDENDFVTQDYRTDRVRIFVNEDNLVSRKPMIG